MRACGGVFECSRRVQNVLPSGASNVVKNGNGALRWTTMYNPRRNRSEPASGFHLELTTFPEERELHERVRLYLNICQRHATPPKAAPRTLQERLYASTLALNGGKYDEAISHLRLVRDEDPDNDHALYMLAVAHAQRGEHAEAIAHLERAIALNSENRALARRDPDLESLRDDDAFLGALESTVRKRS